MVTGRKAGSVTITAKENGFTTSHTMTVIAPVGGDTTNIAGKAIVGKAVL
jgi:hypothetical protein